VLEFFGVDGQSRGRAFLKVAGAVAVGVVLWSFAGFLAGG
jgi:hypothetical protein